MGTHEVAQDGSRTTELSAEFLERLADTLDGAADHKGDHDARLTEIRFQAKRLRRAAPLAMNRIRWIREGLLAAIQSLEARPTCTAFSTWMASARSATEALNESGMLVFNARRSRTRSSPAPMRWPFARGSGREGRLP